MAESLTERWYQVFLETIQHHETATALRDAALRMQLGKWTTLLTTVVVETSRKMGWSAAARGHRSDILPIPREEYLALDAVAFEAVGDRRWRFPLAVFELENSSDDDRVAYSLWKVLSVRASLRTVFCYRRDSPKALELIRLLSDQVITGMGIADRMALGGETMIVIGSRDEAATFPYGFFKNWTLDPNTGRFSRN